MNDYISRHDVTDNIVELWADKTFGNPALSEIMECIKKVPAADVAEVKRGKWIWIEHILQPDDIGGYLCSNCRTGTWDIDTNRWSYCPFCGAKMMEEP